VEREEKGKWRERRKEAEGEMKCKRRERKGK